MEIFSFTNYNTPLLLIFLSCFICFVGSCGLFYYSKNLIKVLISSEVIFIGVNVLFISLALDISTLKSDFLFFIMMLLTLSAIELAFGLMLVLILNHIKSLNLSQ